MATKRTQPKQPAKTKARSTAIKISDLEVPKGGAVKGGRKAGKGQQEFLVVKMNDIIVS